MPVRYTHTLLVTGISCLSLSLTCLLPFFPHHHQHVFPKLQNLVFSSSLPLLFPLLSRLKTTLLGGLQLGLSMLLFESEMIVNNIGFLQVFEFLRPHYDHYLLTSPLLLLLSLLQFDFFFFVDIFLYQFQTLLVITVPSKPSLSYLANPPHPLFSLSLFRATLADRQNMVVTLKFVCIHQWSQPPPRFLQTRIPFQPQISIYSYYLFLSFFSFGFHSGLHPVVDRHYSEIVGLRMSAFHLAPDSYLSLVLWWCLRSLSISPGYLVRMLR